MRLNERRLLRLAGLLKEAPGDEFTGTSYTDTSSSNARVDVANQERDKAAAARAVLTPASLKKSDLKKAMNAALGGGFFNGKGKLAKAIITFSNDLTAKTAENKPEPYSDEEIAELLVAALSGSKVNKTFKKLSADPNYDAFAKQVTSLIQQELTKVLKIPEEAVELALRNADPEVIKAVIPKPLKTKNDKGFARIPGDKKYAYDVYLSGDKAVFQAYNYAGTKKLSSKEYTVTAGSSLAAHAKKTVTGYVDKSESMEAEELKGLIEGPPVNGIITVSEENYKAIPGKYLVNKVATVYGLPDNGKGEALELARLIAALTTVYNRFDVDEGAYTASESETPAVDANAPYDAKRADKNILVFPLLKDSAGQKIAKLDDTGNFVAPEEGDEQDVQDVEESFAGRSLSKALWENIAFNGSRSFLNEEAKPAFSVDVRGDMPKGGKMATFDTKHGLAPVGEAIELAGDDDEDAAAIHNARDAYLAANDGSDVFIGITFDGKSGMHYAKKFASVKELVAAQKLAENSEDGKKAREAASADASDAIVPANSDEIDSAPGGDQPESQSDSEEAVPPVTQAIQALQSALNEGYLARSRRSNDINLLREAARRSLVNLMR